MGETAQTEGGGVLLMGSLQNGSLQEREERVGWGDVERAVALFRMGRFIPKMGEELSAAPWKSGTMSESWGELVILGRGNEGL